MVKKYDEDELYAARKNDTSGRVSYKLSDGQELSYQDTKMAPYGGSKWDSVRDGAVNKLLSMNYNNWTQGDQYKALANRYAQQGQLAMRDVLGQVADRTGGLASSYATAAAQQQYNGYMQDLEAAAREMYGMERNQLMDNAQLAQSLGQEDYGRYLDALNQHNTDRNFAYNSFLDSVNAAVNAENTQYQRGQDKWNNNMAVAGTKAAYGDFSGYEDMGYDTTQMQNYYNKQNADAEYDRNWNMAVARAAYGDFSGLKDFGFSDEKIAAMENSFNTQNDDAKSPDYELLLEIGKAMLSETGDSSILEWLAKMARGEQAEPTPAPSPAPAPAPAPTGGSGYGDDEFSYLTRNTPANEEYTDTPDAELGNAILNLGLGRDANEDTIYQIMQLGGIVDTGDSFAWANGWDKNNWKLRLEAALKNGGIVPYEGINY